MSVSGASTVAAQWIIMVTVLRIRSSLFALWSRRPIEPPTYLKPQPSSASASFASTIRISNPILEKEVQPLLLQDSKVAPTGLPIGTTVADNELTKPLPRATITCRGDVWQSIPWLHPSALAAAMTGCIRLDRSVGNLRAWLAMWYLCRAEAFSCYFRAHSAAALVNVAAVAVIVAAAFGLTFSPGFITLAGWSHTTLQQVRARRAARRRKSLACLLLSRLQAAIGPSTAVVVGLLVNSAYLMRAFLAVQQVCNTAIPRLLVLQ